MIVDSNILFKFATSNNLELVATVIQHKVMKNSTKTMTTSEVAQMVMEMFPKTSDNLNETNIYDETGNSFIMVQEFKSGCSKVSGKIMGWNSYGKLKADEKKAIVEKIKSLQVDIVTREAYCLKRKETFTWVSYFVKGAFEKYKNYRINTYLKSYEVKPFNY